MEFEGRNIDGINLPALIHELRVRRRDIKAASKESIKPRAALTNVQRQQVLAKTKVRCHNY